MKTILPLVTTILLSSFLPLQSAKAEMSSRGKSSTSRNVPTASERLEMEKEAAQKLLSSLTTTQKSKLLSLLNEGTDEDLIAIKGIAKTRAASIVKARPFKKVDEVILVEGVGEGTFTNVVAHGKTLTARRSSKKKS